MRNWINLCEAIQPTFDLIEINARLERLGLTDEEASEIDAQNAYENIMLSAKFKNGKMVVYRGMNVDEDWLQALKPGENIGRYWAYHVQGAKTGSWDKPNVIFTALVDPKKISWSITIAQEIAVGEEYEITLGGVQVELVNIETDSGGDFSNLIGQFFRT